MRIKTTQEVWLLTAAIAAMAVAIPFCIAVVAIILSNGDLSADYAKPLITVAVLVPLSLITPIGYLVVSMIRQQTEMIQAIDSRIMFDMLTGALNRNHFLDTMRGGKNNGPIMIVDADHFKAINDRNGHAIGDEALRILANAIQKTVGEAGIVGRLGGEEFGVFLPGKSEADGREMANSICEAIRTLSPLVSGNRVHLSVSIGCSYHRAAKVIGHSLKEADDLLYRAKAEGRDRAVCMPPETKRRLA